MLLSKQNPFEPSLKRFFQIKLGEAKEMSCPWGDLIRLSGEFFLNLAVLAQALDLLKNVLGKAKRDLVSSLSRFDSFAYTDMRRTKVMAKFLKKRS